MFEAYKALKPTATSSEISAAIEKVKSSLAAAGRELESLRTDRGRVLLTGDNAEIKALEDKTSALALEVERMQVALVEMANRHIAATSREAAKEQAARLVADRAALARGLVLIRRYDELAGEIASCLAEIDEITGTIREGNRLRNEARTVRGESYESVPPPQEAATDNGPGKGKGWRDICLHVTLPIAADSYNQHWPMQAPARRWLGDSQGRAVSSAKAG